MFNLVSELGLIDVIPTECPACGSPTEINDNLTQLRCIDPYCIGKLGERFNDFCNHFSVKGIGLAGLTSTIQEHGFHNPYDLIWLSLNYDDMGTDDYKFFEDIPDTIQAKVYRQLVAVYKRRLTLPELIEAMHLPGIGHSTAQKLFATMTMNDWNGDALAVYRESNAVQDALGISSGNTATSDKVSDTVNMFHDDMINAVNIMNGFLEPRLNVTTVVGAYTDKVPTDYARTKRDFAEFVRNNFPKVEVEWVGSVTKRSDFLISGSGANTNKMKQAKHLGVPVFDEDSFIDWLTDINDRS